jgi:hypothetical protein
LVGPAKAAAAIPNHKHKARRIIEKLSSNSRAK